MNEEAKEQLGRAIDRVDNMYHALMIPMSDEFHIEQFKQILPDIIKELKSSYEEVFEEKIWD